MRVVPRVVPVCPSDFRIFVGFAFRYHQRVSNSNDYEKALRHKALTNKWFTVHFFNSKHEFARLGLIVSKRVIPLAVNRNLAKRLVREYFRLVCAELPTLDFVVKVRRDLSECNREEAKSALISLMREAAST